MTDVASLLISGLGSLFVGGGLGFFAFRSYRNRILGRAQEEAQEILQDIQDELEIVKIEQQEKKQEIELELWTQVEADLLKAEEKIEDLQAAADDKKKKLDDKYSQIKNLSVNQENMLKEREKKVQAEQQKWNQKKSQAAELKKQFAEKMLERFNYKPEEIKSEIQSQLENETKRRAEKFLHEIDADLKDNAETQAKHILDVALDRFMRPYCAERGIGAVHLQDENLRKNFAKPEIVQAIQKSCGCDIIVEEGQELIGVAGFDPVRRELTRRVLEKLITGRNRKSFRANEEGTLSPDPARRRCHRA